MPFCYRLTLLLMEPQPYNHIERLPYSLREDFKVGRAEELSGRTVVCIVCLRFSRGRLHG